MALSNWDIIAWGPDGTCTKGYFSPEADLAVEIYKNYVSVHLGDNHFSVSGKAHLALSNNGTFMNIYVDDEIAPQDGVFIFCDSVKRQGETTIRKNFGAIGCYGFADTVSLVLNDNGIDIAEGDYWIHGTTGGFDAPTEHFVESMGEGEKWRIVYYREGIDDESILEKYEGWVGVLPKTIEKYFQWLKENEYEMISNEATRDWVQKINMSEQLRYNQGDQYFADKLDKSFNDIATAPEQCKEPVIMTLIKNLNVSENGDS